MVFLQPTIRPMMGLIQTMKPRVLSIAVILALMPRAGAALDIPVCAARDAPPHATRPLPASDPRASGHLTLSSPCGEARMDLWNDAHGGVMVQVVWNGRDEHGEFERASSVALFRVRALTPVGTFIPGATHTVRAITRDAIWIERCTGGTQPMCELFRARRGAALVTLGP